MESLNAIIKSCSDFLWGWPMVIILLGTHLFLTVRLRFPQRKLFTAIRLSVKSDGSAKGDVSQFGALATALAATIGTGNIIGVATAVTLGGPGAVFWCWLTGVFGIATKYAEGLLAVKYRIRTPHGKMAGGPMYALERGLHMKWLAVLFCIFTVCASFGSGNLVRISVTQNGETVSYDSENEDQSEDIAAAAGGLGAVTLSDAADYSAEDADMEKYGLDQESRITVEAVYTENEEENTLFLYIGDEDGEGSRYVMIGDSRIVYLISDEVCRNIMNS